MRKIKDIKKYIWIILLISGIILIISVFTPVSFSISPLSGSEYYVWMWGLSYFNSEFSGIIFSFILLSDPLLIMIPMVLLNIIISLVVLVTSIILIVIGNRIRTGRIIIKDKENHIIKIGVIMIMAPIIYVIVTIIFGNMYYDYFGIIGDFKLWEGSSNPGFAFFGPFIGGTLAISVAVASKKMIPVKLVNFAQEKKDIITSTPIQPVTNTLIKPITNRALNFKKYIWIIVLIGGIITIISFFTPAFYANLLQVEEYFWMWGLHYGNITGYGANFSFIPLENPFIYMIPIFLAGIFPALLIILSSIMLIVIANGIRNVRSDLKYYENRIIGYGITLISASVIFLISISITMNNFIEYLLYGFGDGFTLDIWDIYQPGFAIIGPFIGGVLAIIGGIASKTIKPGEKPISIQEMKKYIIKMPGENKMGKFNYCPECGQELFHKEYKFCSNCGFELRI